jgi:hypothetical protein
MVDRDIVPAWWVVALGVGVAVAVIAYVVLELVL